MSNADIFSLDGETALITGASRNIGQAIARAFARAGADLVLVARDANRLERVALAIAAETRRRVIPIAADVSTSEGCELVLDRSLGQKATILVNNAHTLGSHPTTALLETPASVWDEVMATNLYAPIHLSNGFCRGLEGTGSIINVVSGAGLLPAGTLGPYGSSKAALWMYTRYLAVECAPRIRVNALCPGLVSEDGTPRNAAQRRTLPSVPMGRVARPDEIAGAAVYLASPAASYTTGEILVVNGGRPW